MTGQRVDVRGAAEALGISAEAVRKRVARGTIEHERDEEGHVWVFLDEPEDGDRTEGGHREDGRPDVLVEVLREEIAHLRRESERKDAIIMQMAQANGELSRTVRALEAPHHENGHEAHQEDAQEPPHGAGGMEDGERPEKRSWWRRVFGPVE